MAAEMPETETKEIGATAGSLSSKLSTSPITKEREEEAHSLSSVHDDSDSSTSDNEDHDGEGQIRPTRSRLTDGLSRYATGLSVATTTDPNFEVDFEINDPENPKNWPLAYRCLVIFLISYSTLTVVMYSTSYTSGTTGMMSTFSITDGTLIVLGITTYMLGLATGSLFLAPLSEIYGRRPVYLISIVLFCILTVPCALAKNLETILVVRYFGAICGSALISNSPGTVNDIATEEYRAFAFSIWSIGPMNGPVVGPVIGGFVFQYLGWRWTNWIVCIASGLAALALFCVKETYGPTILRKRAAKLRKKTGDSRWWSRYDEKNKFIDMLKINLSRPFSMAVKEPICIFWNLYIALLYGILYLCFILYPVAFSELRGWSAGVTGLSYLGIGIGSLLLIFTEPLIRKMINNHKPDPVTGKAPPEAMVSIVCICSICVPVGEMIFAWTCTPDVHWIAPIVAGIPFGFGNCGVFIYASNYLVYSYGIYAASALAGNGVFRSLLGATLPLAGPAMYQALGIHWSGTMLSILEFACVPIPFIFYRYGHKIREKSTLIRHMQEDKDRLDAKRARNEARIAREALKTGYTGSSSRVAVDHVGAEIERIVSRAEKELVV